MKQEKVSIKSRLRVISNEGGMFLAPLSMDIRPVKLSPFDLSILSIINSHGFSAKSLDSIQELQSKLLGRVMPTALIQQTIQRLMPETLLGGSDHESFKSLDVNIISDEEDIKEIEPDPNNMYQLAANFSLIPTSKGFVFWSVKTREYWLLKNELLCAVDWFIQPRPLANAKGQPEVEAWLPKAAMKLIAIGCLVISPILEAKTDQVIEHVNELNSTKSWESMIPDKGKIPVYFTPHTENHLPLALGMLFTAIGSYEGGALLEKYQLIPISYMHPNELINGLYRKFGPGIWLFSNYMWSIEFNLQFSKGLKQVDSRNLTIHGGPSTPNYQQACIKFLQQNQSVDIAVHGEGEQTIQELLVCIERRADGSIEYQSETLKSVDGITFRSKKTVSGVSPHQEAETTAFIRTSDRARIKEMDTIPSPYLQKTFDHYQGKVQAAIVESNRGCPFGCTFCDWGSATMQKIRKFDVDRVRQEVDWIGKQKIKVLWIADANFGVFDRDIEIAQIIVDTKEKYGYPKEVVVNYTKNTTSRLVEIIKIFSEGNIISQGIISIQTTDTQTLEVINRKNIKTKKYDDLTKIFAAANLPLSTDLMIGLPGSTIESFEKDLQRYIDVDVTTKAYPTQLLPNSPMADPEYMAKYKIKTDKDSYVTSSYSFSEEDLNQMKSIYSIFLVADSYSTLRYVMRYLQWDHGISAISFLHEIRRQIIAEPRKYMYVTWVMRYFTDSKSVPGGWKFFYDEIAEIVENAFGIKREGGFDTALYVNEAQMPDNMVSYPLEIKLDFDFANYFLDNNQKEESVKTLDQYSKGNMVITDPDKLASSGRMFSQYDDHQFFWELRSDICRTRSSALLG